MPIHGDSFSLNPSPKTMNVCLDEQGNELPIRYKASDLVNRPAPDGFHWRGRHNTPYCGEWCDYDYYIAVKDKNAAPAPPERKYYDGQLVTTASLNGHPREVVDAVRWGGEWLYKLANCLGRLRESELSLELRNSR